MAKNSAISTFGLQLLKAFISALTIVLCSRFMGAAGRGELSLVLFYINIVMILNEFVGGSTIANMVIRYPSNKIIPTAWIWSVLTISISIAVLFVMKNVPVYFWSILIFTVSLAFLTIQYSLYQGYQKVFQRNYIQLFLELIKVGGIIDFFLYFGSLKTGNVIQIFAISTAFILLFSLWQLRKNMQIFPVLSPPKELFQSGFWAQSSQLILFLNYRLALIFIGKYCGLSQAGLYSNSLLIADTIWIFANSFGTIAHMRILQSKNQKFKADITLRYASIALVGTILAIIMIFIVPNFVYTGIFGLDFYDLKQAAMWISPAILAMGASTLFSHYLHAENKFKSVLLGNLVGIAIQIMLDFILIPVYGIKGACVAADAGFIGILLVLFFQFRRINPGVTLHGVFRLRGTIKILFRMFG